jgi:hypothetical protein
VNQVGFSFFSLSRPFSPNISPSFSVQTVILWRRSSQTLMPLVPTHLDKSVVSVWWLPTRRRSWMSFKLGGHLFFTN